MAAILPDHLKFREICSKAVSIYPRSLQYVPDCHITQEMSNEAVHKRSILLENVPDGFVRSKQVNLWYDDDYYDDDYDKIIEWYESYLRRKAQKAKI